MTEPRLRLQHSYPSAKLMFAGARSIALAMEVLDSIECLQEDGEELTAGQKRVLALARVVAEDWGVTVTVDDVTKPEPYPGTKFTGEGVLHPETDASPSEDGVKVTTSPSGSEEVLVWPPAPPGCLPDVYRTHEYIVRDMAITKSVLGATDDPGALATGMRLRYLGQSHWNGVNTTWWWMLCAHALDVGERSLNIAGSPMVFYVRSCDIKPGAELSASDQSLAAQYVPNNEEADRTEAMRRAAAQEDSQNGSP